MYEHHVQTITLTNVYRLLFYCMTVSGLFEKGMDGKYMAHTAFRMW